MRTAILLFSLCAGPALSGPALSGAALSGVILSGAILFGSAAFGQSAPGGLLNPNPSGQSPWTAQDRDFGKLPPGWSGAAKAPFGTLVRPAPAPRPPLGDARIDPQMILHPTARDLGTQPPGTLVAQNLYPGLKFQPIDGPQCAPKGGLLSTTWPKLKVEPIPISWPNMKRMPVGTDATTAAGSIGR